MTLHRALMIVIAIVINIGMTERNLCMEIMHMIHLWEFSPSMYTANKIPCINMALVVDFN